MLTPPPRPLGTASGVAGRLLSRLGALAVIGLLLTWLRPILVPLVVAVLGAMLTFPVVRGLVTRRVPGGLAVLAGVATFMLPLLMFSAVFVATIGPLSREMPKYQQQLVVELDVIVEQLSHVVTNPARQAAFQQEMTDKLVPQMINEGMELARSSVKTLTAFIGYGFVTLLFIAFMLFEGQRFREKFTEAYGSHHPLLQSLDSIGRDVRAYILAKTFISALTAFCVWLFLLVCGVDFAVFWGVIAFPLNFIPTVGAMVASIPPVIIAFLDPETTALGGLMVTLGLLAINGFIGSYVDPKFIGRQVKLSPLVVFVSMVVWALIWGPMGAILAVPIMVSVKVVCSHVPGLEPVAILMKA